MGKIVTFLMVAMLSTVAANAVEVNWDENQEVLIRMKVTVPEYNGTETWDKKIMFLPNSVKPDIVLKVESSGKTFYSEDDKAPYTKLFVSMDCRDVTTCNTEVKVSSNEFILTIINLNSDGRGMQLMETLSCKLSNGGCKKNGFIAKDFKIVSNKVSR